MEKQTWQEHHLKLSDRTMDWYDCGQGTPILFLHGCYDSLLYRPLAELFSHKYRCILYDQRGYGATMPDRPDEQFLHIERHLDDINRLLSHLGVDTITILGHSWGASLGVMYAGRFPGCVQRLVLIGMGPVNQDMAAVYKANVLRMMLASDRNRWPAVNKRYKTARLSGHGVPNALDEENVRMWSPVMFYSLANAEEFVQEYLQAGGYRRHGWNATGFAEEDILANARRITAPVLIVYGYQDYEPITQAHTIKERIRHARIALINECGHIVWKDQPDLLLKQVDFFLSEVDQKGTGT